MIDKNLVLVSVALVFKRSRGKDYWLLTNQEDSEDWEFPKSAVRKVESSARASIRMIGEQGGMSVQVLEEAGRAGGVTTVNKKVVPQRHIYYLIMQLSVDGEAIGLGKIQWMEYAKAIKILVSKREKDMLRAAKKELTKWRRENPEEK